MGMSKEDNRKLSFKVFSDATFRKALLDNPRAAARTIDVELDDDAIKGLLKAKKDILDYGQAIDTLVRVGKKDVKQLFDDPLVICVVDGILTPKD